MIAGHKQYVTS